ncbi:MAG: DNA primase, partial [Bergeyella zoohelcum]|nr:DNA primase [Bergeyella zoohelcum]
PLKQEVYLKEVANKFGLSEQSLFNELGIQKQIAEQGQRHTAPTTTPKLEVSITQNSILGTNPLLELEEKLISMMLKYGNRLITLRNAENQPVKTTVIEEILYHFEEDDYEIISPINKQIIEEIKEGISNNELRTGNFFLSLMDENITEKVADNLMDDTNELSDWKRYNIYPYALGERIAEELEDNLLIHKSHLVEDRSYKLSRQLEEYSETNEEEYYETLKKIMILKKLSMEINQKLGRTLTKGHIFFKEQNL